MNWSHYLLLLTSLICLYGILRKTGKQTVISVQYSLFLILLTGLLVAKLIMPEIPDRVLFNLNALLTLIPITILFSLSRVLKPPYMQYPSWYSYIPLAAAPILAEYLQPISVFSIGLMALQVVTVLLFSLFTFAYIRQLENKAALTATCVLMLLFVISFWFFDLMNGGNITLLQTSTVQIGTLEQELKSAAIHLSAAGGIVAFALSLPGLQGFVEEK